MTFPLLCLALSAIMATSMGRAAVSYQVTVAASEVDRLAHLGAFPIPAGISPPAQLRDAAGRTYPLQNDGRGNLRFVVPTQRAGEALSFVLEPTSPLGESITVSRARADLGVNVGDRRTLVFQTDKEALPRPDIEPVYKRAGYLHPIYSPAGAVVTADYPANHPHHHGIWTAWSKVEFQGRATNFWESAEQRGTTEYTGLDRAWNGPVYGGFVARQQMLDFTSSSPTAALNETWVVTAYNIGGTPPAARVFDVVITQSCATADPVALPRNLYGGLGFRGRDEWNGKDNLVVLTSEGATTREAANTSRMRWCYVGGSVGAGSQAGIAILGHPDNVRAPESIRVHPEMPFVSVVPVQLDDLTILPGKPHLARYRFVVTDGPPIPDQIQAYWNGFARPAVVNVTAR
jgi:Methane oxygenase PmoA